MLDLNSYYVIVMNKEGSLSIIDPLVSMVGKTSTLGMIRLRGPGSDWIKSQDEKRLFVSIPNTGHLAVVNTEAFGCRQYRSFQTNNGHRGRRMADACCDAA